MRQKMVQEQIINRGITDENVIDAMLTVPRHYFVPQIHKSKAYYDCPLPIGYNQTISQPYIVAFMTEKLKLSPDDKVLEIGTGSGYQAAILSQIVDSVFTIEIINQLATISHQKLKTAGYANIYCKAGDGYNGWPEHAPFNAIIVTAAPDQVPQPLLDQLAEGGRLIIPVGPTHDIQHLKIYKKERGKIKQKNLLTVRFVPFMRNSDL
ncbi:protein-L-isoaspartate(D-aspartate) O-methyltransferase [Carboxylicivirga linearis]|uniref:Protein-L-isoaspartate O-methyltransferase n=2 Tax=Carboxylicivirga linearis TaxID=1628157 RepID=A0ABS5JWH4_9BACT|nr:protein-L-isoaspartate(D-aspartate) O-methyltransferase [Carboxylicivirga linearis]